MRKMTYLIALFLFSMQIQASKKSNMDDPCLTPTNIQIVNLTTYSVDFEWEDANSDGGSTLFQYTIVEEGDPLGGPTTTQTVGSSVAYMLLSSSTTYNLYLRSMCMGTWSDWSDPVSFTTASCDAVDMPYIQDFENLTSFFNLVECTTWEVVSGNYWSTNLAPVTGFEGNSLSYSASETEDANSWYIIQNGINIEAGEKVRVSFKYKSDGTGTEELALYMATSIDDLINGNGLTIADLTIADTAVTDYVAGPIPFMDASTYYFGFQATSAANQGTIHVDDFRVEQWICGAPDEIEINDISSDGASLSWIFTGDNMTYFYQYVVSTDATEPQEGVSTIHSTGTNFNNQVIGLDANTVYYVYVRSSCSGIWSDWSGPVSFMTLCDSEIALPTGDTEQVVSEGATLANLEVEGENLTWYADQELTIEIEADTVAVDGTTYYVTQTIGNCVSDALSISVTVIDPCADISLPAGDTEQVVSEGAILADLEVEGENLTWYADQELTLEIGADTVAVDGTTYYVTQTIDECTSEALAITVEVTLGMDDIAESAMLKYYPNPVEDFLNISSKSNMTHIEIINIVGQTVISYDMNATDARINMTELSKGNYFVKININGTVKVIKVVR